MACASAGAQSCQILTYQCQKTGTSDLLVLWISLELGDCHSHPVLNRGCRVSGVFATSQKGGSIKSGNAGRGEGIYLFG